jgi:hypothetical protein
LKQLLLVTALVVASSSFAASTTPFAAWAKSGDDADARFCVRLGTVAVSADADGKLNIAGRRAASLRLVRFDMIEWLWSMPVDADYLIAYESTNRHEDSSSGGLCRFSGDLTKRRWCTPFPAFNVAASLSSSKNVFLAGIGTVAEVDIRTGKFLWRVKGLYERSQAFNSFFTAVERGRSVEFYAIEGGSTAKPWVATVDRATGKLSSVREIESLSKEALEVARSAGPCRE